VADHRVRAPARRHQHVVVAFVGLIALMALAIVVLAPRGRPVSGAGPEGTVSQAPYAGTPSTGSPSPGPSSNASTGALAAPRTLVALGDSVPSADTCGCVGYVELVRGRLAALTHRDWAVHNDATGGWTTADVESDLSTAATAAHLAAADLVLIEAGANDFDLGRVDDPGCSPAASSGCWAATLEGLRTGLTQIIEGIHRIDGRPDLRIVLVGYWNVTVDGAVGRARGPSFVLGSDELTRLVNTTVEQTAARTGTVYVDAYAPLKGDRDTRDPTSDLLQDGDHLNASGHALLAGAIITELSSDGLLAGWQGGNG